jgi:hypothetical protein
VGLGLWLLAAMSAAFIGYVGTLRRKASAGAGAEILRCAQNDINPGAEILRCAQNDKTPGDKTPEKSSASPRLCGEPVALAGTYLAGALIGGVSLAFLAELYDRYLIGFLPFLILFVVRSSAGWGRRAWAVAWAGLVAWAGFSLLLKADAIDHDNARWAAGRWLYAQVQPIHLGYDWDHVHGKGDGRYEVADTPREGFRVEARFPYASRLGGFSTREVLALVRADQPPLP